MSTWMPTTQELLIIALVLIALGLTYIAERHRKAKSKALAEAFERCKPNLLHRSSHLAATEEISEALKSPWDTEFNSSLTDWDMRPGDRYDISLD